ncbi:substrate-binding periplasmic protein [Duganella levis]|uniref:Transporter substrate-binding domain-containing protein n=1 Tax=Duganella levis TaxID=2692169 RepID=A0ABW9VYP3_9BURK|nr:transporter substrate-binding domain-containing protein [Duganella levis]MYN26764.1 transporter substrate-binding domain-containing protein [Duganella levis]
MRVPLFLLCVLLNLLWQPAHAEQRPLTLLSFDYPPFMEPTAAPVPASGMAVDIVVEAFRRMKVPVRIVFYPLARGLAMLEAGQADGIFTIKKNPEREARFLFPVRPLLSQDYVIFVRKDSNITFDGDLKSLEHLSIGVLNKSSYGPVFDGAVQTGLFTKLEVANSHEGNFLKLLAHRMDAVVCSRVVGIALLKRLNAEDAAVVTGPVLESAPSYLMFNRQLVSPELVRRFDVTLAAMQDDGTLADIEKKYPR